MQSSAAAPETDKPTSGPVLQFPNIALGGKAGGAAGSLKIQPAAVLWKSKVGGKAVSVAPADIVRYEWSCVGPCYQLHVVAASGASHRFDGFKERDLEQVRSFVRDHLRQEVHVAERALKGANWGALRWDEDGAVLALEVDGRVALDLPVADVAQAQLAGKNDVAIEFHLDDTTAALEHDFLAELRLYVPPTAAANAADGTDSAATPSGPSAAEQLYRRLLAKADVSAFSGTGLATFKDVSLVFPRGKYEVEMYASFMRLHGKTYDYKVLYSNIARVFQLSRSREDRHVYVVVSLDQPIRQGQTRYAHLVFLFARDDAPINVPLHIDDATYEAKYKDKLQRAGEAGQPVDVFCKVFAVLWNKKVSVPSGSFTSHGGMHAIRCSQKANDGLLFPLERAFFFVPKPPVYVHFDEISVVEFARVSSASAGTSTRNFDLVLTLKSGSSLQFTNIVRQEYSNLFEFITAKKLRIKGSALHGAAGAAAAVSDDEEAAAPSARGGNTLATMALPDDEEDDEDFASGGESSDADDDEEASAADDDDENGSDAPKKDKKKDKKEKKHKKDKKEKKEKKEKKDKKDRSDDAGKRKEAPESVASSPPDEKKARQED